MLIVGWRKLPIEYSLYTAGSILIMLSRILEGQPLSGMSRFALSLFPMFILLGLIGERPILNRLILYPAILLNLYLSARFWMWGWWHNKLKNSNMSKDPPAIFFCTHLPILAICCGCIPYPARFLCALVICSLDNLPLAVQNFELEQPTSRICFSLQTSQRHIYSRNVEEQVLTFRPIEEDSIIDEQTGSIWNIVNGTAIQGVFAGKSLKSEQRWWSKSFRIAKSGHIQMHGSPSGNGLMPIGIYPLPNMGLAYRLEIFIFRLFLYS